MKLIWLTLVLSMSAMTCWAIRWNPRVTAAQADIAAFSMALKMFDDDCGRYPTTDEGLAALITRPPDVPSGKWKKYLDADRIPTDPWDHPYVYRCPGVHNTNSFDIYSWGPRGKSKSGGDVPGEIGNWTPTAEIVTTGDGALPGGAGVGVAVFLVVIALAWAERRFRKSEGNLHGVYALLWLAATPAFWMALPWVLGVWSLEPLGFVVLLGGWLAALLFWTISGRRRGSPFSKFCAYVVVFLILVFLPVAIVIPSFS
jgi:type II secretion system protein G